MSYSLASDSIPTYSYDVAADGTRSFSDTSRWWILSQMETMYVGPQIPNTDDAGQLIFITPGQPPSGLPNALQTIIAAARAGWTALILDVFQDSVSQALRLTSDPSKLAELTVPGSSGGYVVLLTPEQAQSMSPTDPQMSDQNVPGAGTTVTIPGVGPIVIPPGLSIPGLQIPVPTTPVSPAPPPPPPPEVTPTAPPAPTTKAGLLGLSPVALAVGGGVIALVILASLMKKEPARSRR